MVFSVDFSMIWLTLIDCFWLTLILILKGLQVVFEQIQIR